MNKVVSPNTIKRPNITFTSAYFKGLNPIWDNHMLITLEITNCLMKRTLINQGSFANILFWSTFKQLEIPELTLQPHDEPLFGSTGEKVGTGGRIELSTKLGSGKSGYKEVKIWHFVTHANTSYNILLG